jgi:hypothetical protein
MPPTISDEIRLEGNEEVKITETEVASPSKSQSGPVQLETTETAIGTHATSDYW